MPCIQNNKSVIIEIISILQIQFFHFFTGRKNCNFQNSRLNLQGNNKKFKSWHHPK